jgi:TIR domain
MNGQIFISYRREDASYPAGRLYDNLHSRFPQNEIFMDVDSLKPGIDFVQTIEERVGACDVLVAVIGKRWLSAADEESRRRLDNPDDFVRVEVGTALKSGRSGDPRAGGGGLDASGQPAAGRLETVGPPQRAQRQPRPVPGRFGAADRLGGRGLGGRPGGRPPAPAGGAADAAWPGAEARPNRASSGPRGGSRRACLRSDSP